VSLPNHVLARTNPKRFACSRTLHAVFPIGQAATSLLPDGNGLRVALKTLTSNFKTHPSRIDGSDWKPVANAFTWTPLACSRSDPHDPPPYVGGYSANRVEVKAVNHFGACSIHNS